MKDIHDFPTSFLAHLERARIEKYARLVKAYETEEDGSFKKFSHKKDITQDLYYNVICGDVIEMIQKVPKKEYTLLIVDIPYGFRTRMTGSSCAKMIHGWVFIRL